MSYQIFLGAGAYSEAGCYRLHKRLEDAIEILGGIQQPNMSTEEPDPDGDIDIWFEEGRVELIAAEIYTALTGKAVVICSQKKE